MDKLIRKEQGFDHAAEGQMIRVRKGEEKPPGSWLMTEGEVLHMQMKRIESWKPRSEMWPFSWGLGVLGGSAALTGAFINNFCRSKLGLMHFGRTATYVPTVAIPVVMGSFFHRVLVTDKILVGKFPCTVCAATRSGAIQSLIAGVYPMILGPLVCIVMARKYHTYAVPNITNINEMIPFLKKTSPVSAGCLLLVLANFALGMAIAERETFLFAKYLSPTSQTLMKQDKEFAWGE